MCHVRMSQTRHSPKWRTGFHLCAGIRVGVLTSLHLRFFICKTEIKTVLISWDS